ncbi:MAG: hypothetical protein KFF73_16890 [Cyclobacteriaceae bacterium]|nr:hypothetical protein [Cyclobacteriaceae bacterium]
MSRCITISVIIMLFYAPLIAQEVISAVGFAQIRLEDHMSKEEAREEARQQAIINAIESAFGAYVEKDADVDIEDGKTSFKIIGHTRVRGDWLKTISEKYGEDKRKIRGRTGKEPEIWISCRVEGRIREIGQPETALEFIPLNCPDLICRTYDFKDGEPFYLSFRTSADGFLSIFLMDVTDMVYRLLPYQKMPVEFINAVPVKADNPYLFFLNQEGYDYFPGFSYMMIDEIIMSAGQVREFLDLYIVFSTSDFVKPMLDSEEEIETNTLMPKSLDYEKFEEWLGDNRIHDPEFLYKRVTLIINK